jgi:hypothetical protein
MLEARMRRFAAVRILLLSTACLVLCSPVALAQSTEGPTVFAAGALHRLWSDESSIGMGVAAGGGISAPLTDRFVVRARAMRSRNRRDFNNGVIFETDAMRYTAEALWKFSDGPRAAYIGVGAGAFAFDHESVFGPNPQDPLHRGNQTIERFTSSGTDLIWGGIAGFTAASRGRFRVQPEVSIWLSQGYHIVIEGAVLAGWRW